MKCAVAAESSGRILQVFVFLHVPLCSFVLPRCLRISFFSKYFLSLSWLSNLFHFLSICFHLLQGCRGPLSDYPRLLLLTACSLQLLVFFQLVAPGTYRKIVNREIHFEGEALFGKLWICLDSFQVCLDSVWTCLDTGYVPSDIVLRSQLKNCLPRYWSIKGTGPVSACRSFLRIHYLFHIFSIFSH